MLSTRLAVVLCVIAFVSGCASFFDPPAHAPGAATQPSPAQNTAAALNAAASLTAGTPVSPILSLSASLLAIVAATYAKGHATAAKGSACEAGKLVDALAARSPAPPAIN